MPRVLNRGHRLASGLVGCWVAEPPYPSGVNSYIHEMVRGQAQDALRQESAGGTAFARHTAAGLAMGGASAARFRSPTSTVSDHLKIANNVSMFWYGTLQGDCGNAANGPCIVMVADPGTFLESYSFSRYNANTSITFRWNNSGADQLNQVTGVLSSTDYERPLAISATFGPSIVKGYKNGREVFSGGTAVNISYTANSRIVMNENLFFGDYANAMMALLLVWNRLLLPGEHAELARDPWQIFTFPSVLTTLTSAAAAASGTEHVSFFWGP